LRPLACLRHEEPDDLGIGEAVLAAEGVPIEYVDLWRQAPPSLTEVSGLVVLGGDMNADDVARFPFLSTERDLLAEAAAEGVPVLGICLGAQLLARALGAAVTRSPRRELGFFPVRATAATAADPLASCFQDGDLVFQWHRDTFALPDRATLLLEGKTVTNQAFRAGERAWGFQFHFEVTREELERWFGLAGPSLERVWDRTGEELRREADRYLPRQHERSEALFSRFAGLLRQEPRSQEAR
jgi:GMP synthase (glutamine-hydrolysing)